MPRRAQKNVGVIGLGIIGQRVADKLRQHGFQVFVWNRTPRPYPNFVGSPRELAEVCDFIQIFVADDEALLATTREMMPALGAHHIVLAHSTVAPESMRSAAENVRRRGAEFLDAPFTGSKNAAEKGELVYYIGGDELALRLARPVLEASSKEILVIGAIGDATTVKIATNMITGTTVQVAIEALALADRAGISAEKFCAALRNNAIHSGTLGFKMPKIIEGDFEPHFSAKHMLKDMRIATRVALSYDLEIPATTAARDRLEIEVREGRGDDDFSSVARQYFGEGGSGKNERAKAERQLELSERTAQGASMGDQDLRAAEEMLLAGPPENHVEPEVASGAALVETVAEPGVYCAPGPTSDSSEEAQFQRKPGAETFRSLDEPAALEMPEPGSAPEGDQKPVSDSPEADRPQWRIEPQPVPTRSTPAVDVPRGFLARLLRRKDEQ